MSESEETTEQTAPVPARGGSSFANDVLKLAGGTAFAQTLSILVAPILSRLYAPDAFGTAAIFASIISIVGVVSCLRYELAIMLPASDRKAANLMVVSSMSVVFISGLSLILVLFLRAPILRLLNAPELGPYLWLAPIAVFLHGMLLVLNYWNSRTKHFGRLSGAPVLRSVTTNGLQVGLGAAGHAQVGSLIGSRIVGSALVTTLLGAQTWREVGPLVRQSVSRRALRAGVRRYRKFPQYGTSSALLNSISWQLPTFLLSFFFSSTIVGFYALGTRVLRLPMGVIGQAIGRVFFQRAAEAKQKGSLPAVVESSFRRLVALGMFPLLLLTIIGRDLFVVVFGERWAEAGVYTQILSIWTFFWFISSPLSTLYSVLERQEFGLALNALIFATRFISLGIGGLQGNARLALLLFGISGALIYGYLSLTIMAAAGVRWRTSLAILGSNLALFVPAGLVLATLQAVGASSVIIVAISGLLLAVYYLFMLRRDPELRGLVGHIRTAIRWPI
jgi:O-antigen/teichoic acid export membrane protein